MKRDHIGDTENIKDIGNIVELSSHGSQSNININDRLFAPISEELQVEIQLLIQRLKKLGPIQQSR